MRQELLRGGSDKLVLSVSEFGRPLALSSVTARLFDSGGNLLESGSATNGQYSPNATTAGQARQDCSVEWSFTLPSGEARRSVELFDVVLFKLYPVATEAELIREAPSLVSSERVYSGQASAADASSITDASLIGSRESWEGAVLSLLSGTQAGKQHIVSAFDPALGKLTYPAASAAAVGDDFLLRRSYQAELDAAWDDLYDRLVQMCSGSPGGLGEREARAYLVMTPDRLRRPHILLALAKAFRGIATDTSGADWARAELYEKAYETAMNGLRLVFAQEGNQPTPAPASEGKAQWGFGR